MKNSTAAVVSFMLSAYGDIGELKYLYFCITLSWYLTICVANMLLIVVIYADRRLHEPMYILLCNLFVNEISGSTSLYPLLLSQMLSDSHEVTLPCCFLQMCWMYTSASVEFCSLAAMAYDRYNAICHPLHYSVTMNTFRVFTVILLVWLYSYLSFIISFSFIRSLNFCGNIIEKVFCDHQLLINLACSVSVFTYICDIFFFLVTIAIPFAFISVSYIKILIVCQSASIEKKQKAFTTCTPQIISVSNLFVGCIFHFADSQLKASQVPDKVRIILSVYLLVCQPVVTPFIYGLKLPKIRHSCKRLFEKINMCSVGE
ncbi:olfactory receptor 7G1-like [Pholidichthys leucotaenia]